MTIVKRLLCLLLCLLLPCSALGDGLRFSLHGAAVPAEGNELAAGLADLVNITTLEGTAAFADGAADLRADLLLEGDERTRTALRVYGVESDLCVESSLLGDQTLILHMNGLLEFAMKMYNHMAIPLQHAAILYPFSTADILNILAGRWVPVMYAVPGDRTISAEVLVDALDVVAETMRATELPFYWVQALAGDTGCDELIFSLLDGLPAAALEAAAETGLTITADGDGEQWRLGDTVIAHIGEGKGWVSLSGLPDGCMVDADWDLTAPDALHLRFDLTQDDVPMLHALAEFTGLPTALPMTAPMTGRVELTGEVVSTHETAITFSGSSDGDMVTLRMAIDGLFDELTISGTMIPDAALPAPDYTAQTLDGFNFFTMADVSLVTFVDSVKEPLIRGAIPLVVHMPVSTCVTVMDILTEGNVIGLMLGGGLSADDDEEWDTDDFSGSAWDDEEDDGSLDDYLTYEEDDWDF